VANTVEQLTLYRSALMELYRRDFVRFGAEQLWIRGAEPGAVLPFHMKSMQQHMWKLEWRQLKEKGYIRACIVKPRQGGSSTLAQAIMFWQASLNKNFNCLLLALDDDNTQNIFNMSRFYYEHMDELIRPETRYSSKREIVFDADKRRNVNARGLGSSMQFQNSTRIQAGTGTTRHGVHISEASKFNPDACSLLEHSLMPAIHLLPGTIIINESTTFVTGDWFRGCCDRARSGKSEFILIFVPWWFEPEYQIPLEKGEKFRLTKEEQWLFKLARRGQPEYQVDPFEIRPEQFKWRRLIIGSRQDGEQFFPQEFPHSYEDAWISRDLYVFDRRKLMEQEKNIKEPLILGDIYAGTPKPKILATNAHFNEETNYLAIFKEPEHNHKYDIGADVAVGVEGGDWSTAEVFDRDTHEQVAELHVHLDVYEFAEKLYWLGYYYNIAQLIVEINSVGTVVHGRLASDAYPYLYRWRHRDRDVPQITKLGGWLTAKNSKPHLVALYRTWVHRDNIIIRSRLLLEEMRDFVTIPGFSDYGGDQYRAQRGHDDLVMAAGMALIGGDDENYGVLRGPQAAPEIMDQASIAERLKRGIWNVDQFKLPTQMGEDFNRNLVESMKGWK
jgi:hypothetical protein